MINEANSVLDASRNKLKEMFDKNVSASAKRIILYLSNEPFLMEIGRVLYHIPPAIPVDRDGIIKAMGNYLGKNNIGYVKFNKALDTLEKKGYIKVERWRREENYFPTKDFARAIEVITAYDKAVVQPLAKKAKKNSEFHADKTKLETFVHDLYAIFLGAVRLSELETCQS